MDRNEMLTGKSMAQILFSHARSRPQHLCVADPDEAMTYGQMALRIREKAHALEQLGIRAGDFVVAVCAQRGDYLALEFAVQELGAVFVPVEKRIPREALERVCRIVHPALVVHRPDLESGSIEPAGAYVTKTQRQVPAIEAGTQRQVPASEAGTQQRVPASEAETQRQVPAIEAEAWPQVQAGESEAIATILFTTGTTGASKGIMISHRAEVAVAQNVFYGTAMEEDTVELIPTPINHSYGLRHCFGLLLGGRSIVLCDGVTMAEDFFTMIDRYQVNALSLTPAMVNILLHLTGERLGSYAGRIRYLQLGTAGVDGTMKDTLRRLLPESRLYQYYSSTEAGCACIFDFRDDTSKRRVGRPAVNSTFTVLDDQGNEMRSDAAHWGYLACKGPMNMSGYYQDPLLTQKTVIRGYVRSGDLGYLDEEGYVCFVAREGDVINCGGNKIAPEEVEAEAMRFGNLRECALCAKEDAVLGQVPWLFIVPEEGAFCEDCDSGALLRFLSGRLERYKVPVRVVPVRKLPRNALGKLMRGRCMELVDESVTVNGTVNG